MSTQLAVAGTPVTTDSEPPYVAEPFTFDEFYRREYPGLVGVATVMAGGMNQADDLVQDAMVRTLVHWGRVRTLQRPGGWCHRVLLNVCRDWYRRRRIEARFLARRRPAEPSMAGPTGDALAFCEAVRRLPARPRSVVALHYVGELSTVEIAEVLKVPEGTVRSDLTRARRVLADELGGGHA